MVLGALVFTRCWNLKVFVYGLLGNPHMINKLTANRAPRPNVSFRAIV